MKSDTTILVDHSILDLQYIVGNFVLSVLCGDGELL